MKIVCARVWILHSLTRNKVKKGMKKKNLDDSNHVCSELWEIFICCFWLKFLWKLKIYCLKWRIQNGKSGETKSNIRIMNSKNWWEKGDFGKIWLLWFKYVCAFDVLDTVLLYDFAIQTRKKWLKWNSTLMKIMWGNQCVLNDKINYFHCQLDNRKKKFASK